MKIILLKDVKGVGKKYEVKDVGDGYAINMLIPKGLAHAATASAIKNSEAIKAKDSAMKAVDEELARKNIEELASKKIELVEKANEKGHLFASVHTKEISLAVKKQTRLDILPEWIVLEKPIKLVGEYDIEVALHGVTGSFKLLIKAE